MVGSPDAVARMLAEHRDRRLTHLPLNSLSRSGRNAVRRSMRLFAEQLMPAVKQW
jgi:hypothetical protein